MKLKIFLLTAFSAAGLMLPVSSFAITSNVSVRLGQPKTPTNQSTLKLTFVALDTNGGSITVGCYKKSSLDADFIKFDSDKVLIPGGNTDYCNVDSSILSTAGTYKFMVKANSVSSNVVSVDYNSSGPATPGNYSKDKINSCDYRIKYKTADDGKTVKVELFRSDSKSITVDSGSRVATQNIGPNQDGEFVVGAPECTKEYYFVIRAVDSYGNVSGTTGDDFSKVTIEGTTTSTGNTAQSALVVGSDSQVSGGATSESSTVTPTPSTEVSPTAAPTPEVLGAKSSKLGNLKWLALPLVLIAAFFFLKAKKRA
jgi:hypothetical protein